MREGRGEEIGWSYSSPKCRRDREGGSWERARLNLLPSTREVREGGRAGIGWSKALLRARKEREGGSLSTGRSKE